MRNFDHENVMRMIGFAVKSNNPYILLPYMENKDLRTYLKQNKQVHIYTYVTLYMCILYVYTYIKIHCNIRSYPLHDIIYIIETILLNAF